MHFTLLEAHEPSTCVPVEPQLDVSKDNLKCKHTTFAEIKPLIMDIKSTITIK